MRHRGNKTHRDDRKDEADGQPKHTVRRRKHSEHNRRVFPVFPRNISKTDVARIIRLDTEMFHGKSWKPIYFNHNYYTF